ncbi:MAG: hypothetical protein E7588_00600 [Ruminococcaceae bacterium]|nr:hypothetical protein [Oscillospiraceae bacterium]
MQGRYNIAGLITEIDFISETLAKQSAAYAYSGGRPTDIYIKVPDQVMDYHLERNPHLTRGELDYILTGFDFSRQVINYNAFVMHSSCVMYDNEAFLFSADCGTGKSTHASFWQKNFGEDNALILNDDKPLIIKKNGVFHAAGTPWSGKSDKNLNFSAPIAGIALLERAVQNSVVKISAIEAFKELFRQTFRPNNAEDIDKVLAIFNDFLASTGLFRLHCNMSCEAAQTAYEAMRTKRS